MGWRFVGRMQYAPTLTAEKMIAAGVCYAVLPEKQAAFWGCYEVGGGKRGAFTCPCVGAY